MMDTVLKLYLEEEVLQKYEKWTGSISYDFLGFTLDLQKNGLTDNFGQPARNFNEWHLQLPSTLLTHYSNSALVPPSGKLMKPRDLPGGCAYEETFIKRVVSPIAEVFGQIQKSYPNQLRFSAEKPLNMETPQPKSRR
jgi:hypothetical protein